ncbi:MAG: hypothetical protein ABEK59_11205 [Halobacteria archaeon]
MLFERVTGVKARDAARTVKLTPELLVEAEQVIDSIDELEEDVQTSIDEAQSALDEVNMKMTFVDQSVFRMEAKIELALPLLFWRLV